MDIRANLEAVRERIARAAERAGRRPEAVLLVAVSKGVDLDRIRQAIAVGVPALGENRIQEARGKVAELGRPVPWHLVGHLQTNKVRDALACFDLIHSLDRLALAQELDRRARAEGRAVDVLVQVNVAEEAAKGGFRPADLKPALEVLTEFGSLRVRGLMTIPPLPRDPEESRPHYRELRRLQETTAGWGLSFHLAELSMGMSGDFEVAIEEGATMVRIGTAIFGPRER